MFRYAGILHYETNNSGRRGLPIHLELLVSFFPGDFSVRAEGGIAETVHTLRNRRFNYQARDSPQDLLARDKWRSRWFGRFTGPVRLGCPRISGVPTELQLTLICSWGPAFAIVEFRLGDTFYQLSCRPPRGLNAWARCRFTGHSTVDSSDNEPPIHEPASGPNEVPEEIPPPMVGIIIIHGK